MGSIRAEFDALNRGIQKIRDDTTAWIGKQRAAESSRKGEGECWGHDDPGRSFADGDEGYKKNVEAVDKDGRDLGTLGQDFANAADTVSRDLDENSRSM